MNGSSLLPLVAALLIAGVALGCTQRPSAEEESAMDPATAPAADPVPTPAPAPPDAREERVANIYRMDGSLEQLRGFAGAGRMTVADSTVYRVLPPNLEAPERTLGADDILEAYVNAEHTRYLFIMKPGDRAYAVNVN